MEENSEYKTTVKHRTFGLFRIPIARGFGSCALIFRLFYNQFARVNFRSRIIFGPYGPWHGIHCNVYIITHMLQIPFVENPAMCFFYVYFWDPGRGYFCITYLHHFMNLSGTPEECTQKPELYNGISAKLHLEREIDYQNW